MDPQALTRKMIAAKLLKIKTLNPCDRLVMSDGADPDEIVPPDKKDIDRSIAILAHCWKPSAGTSMEILYAWERGKYVVCVVPDKKKTSAWIWHHSHVVTEHLSEAIEVLNKNYKEN